MDLSEEEMLSRLELMSDLDLLNLLKNLADERIEDLYSCHENNREVMLSMIQHIYNHLAFSLDSGIE